MKTMAVLLHQKPAPETVILSLPSFGIIAAGVIATVMVTLSDPVP
jgi:hypothetical protein